MITRLIRSPGPPSHDCWPGSVSLHSSAWGPFAHSRLRSVACKCKPCAAGSDGRRGDDRPSSLRIAARSGPGLLTQGIVPLSEVEDPIGGHIRPGLHGPRRPAQLEALDDLGGPEPEPEPRVVRREIARPAGQPARLR